MKSVEELVEDDYDKWDFTSELKNFIKNIIHKYHEYND